MSSPSMRCPRYPLGGNEPRVAMRPLLLLSWRQGMHLAGVRTDPLPARVDAWCWALHAPVQAAHAEGSLLASRGAEVAEAAWSALALHVAGERLGRPQWSSLARDL